MDDNADHQGQSLPHFLVFSPLYCKRRLSSERSVTCLFSWRHSPCTLSAYVLQDFQAKRHLMIIEPWFKVLLLQVVGIWFYDRTECDKVVALLDQISSASTSVAMHSSASQEPPSALQPPISNPQYNQGLASLGQAAVCLSTCVMPGENCFHAKGGNQMHCNVPAITSDLFSTQCLSSGCRPPATS